MSRDLPEIAPAGLPVSVVVVNYNGGEAVERCLDSLTADREPKLEILVVDNASNDGSLETLEARARTTRGLRLLSSPRNLGYAGAINLALEQAAGEYLAVLNMDVVVEPRWLSPLVAFLEDHPRVGAVTPLLTLADGRRVNAVGQKIHVSGLGFNQGLGSAVADLARDPVQVSGLQGSAFVIRRELLERLGGVDTMGFLYHEDVNLSWLLRMAGHELYCVPESVVRHDYDLAMYPEKLHLLERNRWAMLLAYLKWSTLLALSPWLTATEMLVWGYALLEGGPFLKAKATGYRWLWRRRRAIASRRSWARSVRQQASDWRILRQLHFSYDWGQFLTLGKARGRASRQPVGGLPTEAG